MTDHRHSGSGSAHRYDRRFVLRMTATGGIAAAGFISGASQLMAQEASPVPPVAPDSSPVPPPAASPVAMSPQFAYVGSDSRTASTEGADPETTGISVFAVNPDDGTLSHVQSLPSDNAFFFAFDPTGRFLYAVNVIGDYEGGTTGSVEAYSVDRDTGMLTFINRQPSGGGVAAHLSVDPTGRHLIVANYGGANFVLLPINEDGSLEPVSSEVAIEGSGPNPRQDVSRPHAVTFHPSGEFIIGADLGTDKVFTLQINPESGELEVINEASTAAGAGPRHVAFNEAGNLLYVVNELNATIEVFEFSIERGAVGDLLQTISTVPDPFEGTKSTAEIFIHPSGKLLYNSNRGQADSTTPEGDAIVVFSVDEETGELTLVGHMLEEVEEPWSFAFDATGTWLYSANYAGNSITQYSIDQNTGALTYTGNSVETPRPFVIVMSNQA